VSGRTSTFDQDPLFIEVANNQVLDRAICLPHIESLGKKTLDRHLRTIENDLRTTRIRVPGKCGLGRAIDRRPCAWCNQKIGGFDRKNAPRKTRIAGWNLK